MEVDGEGGVDVVGRRIIVALRGEGIAR